MDTNTQVLLAETGQAVNQCRYCKSYRLDGKPPRFHIGDCNQKRADQRLREETLGLTDSWQD